MVPARPTTESRNTIFGLAAAGASSASRAADPKIVLRLSVVGRAGTILQLHQHLKPLHAGTASDMSGARVSTSPITTQSCIEDPWKDSIDVFTSLPPQGARVWTLETLALIVDNLTTSGQKCLPFLKKIVAR